MNTLAHFVAQLKECSQQQNPYQSHFYQIGERSVRIDFGGATGYSHLASALTHLVKARPSKPELTIGAWTGEIALPPFPAGVPTDRPWIINQYPYQCFFQPAGPTFYLLDQQEGWAIYWLANAQQLSLADSAAPFLPIFHWWLSQSQAQVIHGAAVGLADGGVLLAGKGGMGKSSTAFCCLAAGWFYLADDYCLVTTNPTPTLHSLYHSGKIHFSDTNRLPQLQQAKSSLAFDSADKALYLFHDQFHVTPQLPLRAILLPTITGKAKSHLRPASAAAVLLALAPSTTFQLPGHRPQIVQTLGQLVRQVPGYVLELGTDPTHIPAVMAQLFIQ